MRKFWKYSIIAVSILVLSFAGLVVFGPENSPAALSLPPARTYSESAQPAATIESIAPPAVNPNAASPTLPAEMNFKIPFTSQAPRQNWDLPYQEFCEEASTLMAASYIKGQNISGPDDADAKLLAIKAFEEKRFGFYEDTTAEETAVILREYFGLEKVNIISNPAANDIKLALAEGKAVVVPVVGRQLGNPNFRQPGPLYHMLVIKGYKKNGDFITNDPGTRRGADYVYKASTIINAIHDWNGGDVNAGRKMMIVVG